jgi:hypothetical protein
MSVVQCVVWVCPTEGCGNYFASSSVGDLAAWNTTASGVKRFQRSRCPVCFTRGIQVQRIPFIIGVNPAPGVEEAITV